MRQTDFFRETEVVSSINYQIQNVVQSDMYGMQADDSGDDSNDDRAPMEPITILERRSG